MNDAADTETMNVVRDYLREIGYGDSLLISDYKFRDFREDMPASGDNARRIELAAFAQTRHDMRSACIGVTVSAAETAQSIDPYRTLGAPLILSLNPHEQRVTRWKMPASGLPEQLGQPTPYDQLERLFRENESKWSPEIILRAKAIAFIPSPPQLDFVDAGYLPGLEDDLRVKLTTNLNNILAVCKKTYKRNHSEEVFEGASESLYRMLFRLVIAKYSIDRGKQPEWAELSASEVLREVETFFFRGKTLEPVLDDPATRNAAWQEIVQGLNLFNLSPEVLAHLSENVLVTSPIRKKYGVHATSPVVAEYMVSQLPIGDLDREDRRIFEPFCGAAPFLIAGLGQLQALETAQISAESQHDYFRRMLKGIEISPFTREIALCSLILADDANRNSWEITHADAFTSIEFDQYLQWANIVLCNPPHETFAKAEQEQPADAVYANQAAEVLHRVLRHRPALLGFVLPRAFVDGKAFRTLRADIVSKYSNVSVVTLPDKAFEKADQEVALLMAHNLRKDGNRYYSANVSEEEWDAFQHTRKPFDEWEDTHPKKDENGAAILWQPPLYHLWDYLTTYPRLYDYVEISRGIEYKCPVKECVFDSPNHYTRPGLPEISPFIEMFITLGYKHLSTNKECIVGNKLDLAWNFPKVLASKSPLSRNYWRIASVADYERLIAMQQFFILWPRDDAPLELIAALINSPVVNAFSFAHDDKRNNRVETLERSPAPRFTTEQAELIVSLVQDYATQRLRWLKDKERGPYYQERCLNRLWQIDAAVLEAYALPAEMERELLNRFKGVKRTPLPFDFPGYGEGYERAKEALFAEKTYVAAVRRYRELCQQKYSSGVKPAEIEEMQQLGQVIDAHEAESNPLYGLVGIAEGGPSDGAENHDAYIYRP